MIKFQVVSWYLTFTRVFQVVSWYQFTTNCGYKDVAKLCLNFIKWNFDVVSESIDWPNLELDSLIQVKSDSYL